MKNFSSVVFALVTAALFIASPAFAQESTKVKTNIVFDGLPAELAQCIAKFSDAGELHKGCVPSDKKAARDQVTQVTMAQAKRRVRRSHLQLKVDRLAGQHHELSDEQARMRDELRAELARIDEELAALKAYHDLIIERLSAVEVTVAEHEKEITTLQGEVRAVQEKTDAIRGAVDDHEDRITALEGSNASLELGGRAVALKLCSTDGTCYGGLAVGPRFGMNIGGNVVSVDAQAMTGFAGKNPYGVRIRGGYQIALSKLFALDTGLSGSFADLDPSLDAHSAFVGMDMGIVLTAGILNVGASAFGGAELDQNDPAAAFGGMLTLGVDLPQ